jgi:Undecaprenyl-phosphate galactose phosphotransferase WbaP
MYRWLFRVIATNSGLWGEPVAVAGNGPQTQRTVKFLLERMRLGIRPVVIIDDTGNIDGSLVPRVAMDHFLTNASQMRSIQTAVLVDSELSETLRNSILDKQSFGFKRLILISDFSWIGSLGVTPYDLEGLLGLEIRQNLLNKWDQRVKRIVDIIVSLMMGVITLPLTLLLSLLIPLDSHGSILYGQARIGKEGKPIIVWKFRTMVGNADQVLENYLTKNSVAKAEWRANQKLKHDPRVTRVGGFLRRTSLDELPQLWNVLKGEMSLVGPRPIVPEEIERYQQGYLLYQRVRPGITGLWQVSGRTNVSYADRLHYDEYYVRNWSIWLDIYILLRTIWVVIRGEGAY